MKLHLIRHGPTDWNAEKRIQGRIDRPLSDLGIETVRACRLPAELRQLRWYCSPLQRARQTAELLNIENPVIENAITEMHWGDWEGRILKPLRKQLGDAMRENEARGLDFCPPRGESPRQVQQRLQPWLKSIGQQRKDCGAIVHKGIIRCIYAMAFDWNMQGESPLKFDWLAAHEFEVDQSGHVQAHYLSRNIRL
jgi:probable phosphoglycerate mutase